MRVAWRVLCELGLRWDKSVCWLLKDTFPHELSVHSVWIQVKNVQSGWQERYTETSRGVFMPSYVWWSVWTNPKPQGVAHVDCHSVRNVSLSVCLSVDTPPPTYTHFVGAWEFSFKQCSCVLASFFSLQDWNLRLFYEIERSKLHT